MKNDEKKEKLLLALQKIKELQLTSGNRDPEEDHIKADELLLEYINDELIIKSFKEIEKWYA